MVVLAGTLEVKNAGALPAGGSLTIGSDTAGVLGGALTPIAPARRAQLSSRAQL